MYENVIPLLCSRTVAAEAARDSFFRSTATINLTRHRREQWLNILSIIPPVSCRYEWKTPARIVGLRAEMKIWNLPESKQSC
jgi:hypothetical protein